MAITVRPIDIQQAGKDLVANPFLAGQIRLRYSSLPVEEAFARLVAVTRAAKDDLEARIKRLQSQMRQLEQMSEKLRKIQAAMERLYPALLEAVGADNNSTSCPPTAGNVTLRSSRLKQALERELALTGMPLDPRRLNELTEAMAKGGSGDPESEAAAILARILAIVNQAPLLFQIPGLRP